MAAQNFAFFPLPPQISKGFSCGIVVPVQSHGPLKLCVGASLGSFCETLAACGREEGRRRGRAKGWERRGPVKGVLQEGRGSQEAGGVRQEAGGSGGGGGGPVEEEREGPAEGERRGSSGGRGRDPAEGRVPAEGGGPAKVGSFFLSPFLFLFLFFSFFFSLGRKRSGQKR